MTDHILKPVKQNDSTEPADLNIEPLAQASWEAVDGYVSGVPWSAVQNSLRGEKERRRVEAVLSKLAERGIDMKS
jgi:hypothetical protein